jgi:membrane fusion protein, multidrug efflux system
MRKGQPAEIIADAVPGVAFHGRVASLAPATGTQFSVIPPENATGNSPSSCSVPVRIQLEDYAAELGKLRPGLSVIVRVDTRQSTGVPVDERQGTPAHNEKRQGPPVRDAGR